MTLEILKSKIENINSKKHLMKIFKIISDNDEHYIFNECGVFIPMNKLTPETIEQIENYIKGIKKNISKIDELKQSFSSSDEKLNLPRHEQRIYNKYVFND
jgi:hypothetical protein